MWYMIDKLKFKRGSQIQKKEEEKNRNTRRVFHLFPEDHSIRYLFLTDGQTMSTFEKASNLWEPNIITKSKMT